MIIILKRIFDFTASLFGLILLLPLFIIIAVLIKLDSKGPVFFKQERVGKDGKLFIIYKFRTMVENAENMGAGTFFEGENDPRITIIGKYLRKFSIDELPQLINIINGDMSIVGPRPCLKKTYEYFNNKQKKRTTVKPGITGLAQVNGRNNLTWDKRVEYDLKYICNYSVLLDIKIIFKTFYVVILRKDINLNQKPEDVYEEK